MRNITGIDLNAYYRNGTMHYGASKESTGQPKPFTNPDVFRPSTPDVYRPSNPHVPGVLPDYPDKPLWLPPAPSGPIIEIPNNLPMELPPYPGYDDWANLPKPPAEMPDWSKMPKELPFPGGPGVTIPKELPSTPFTIEVPDSKFPQKTFPDGAWLLS